MVSCSISPVEAGFFFAVLPAQELEKIPYDFSYKFKCDEAGCTGHEMICTDWEMGQSYRQWVRTYGARWEEYFIKSTRLR